jgi:hypothetical protein
MRGLRLAPLFKLRVQFLRITTSQLQSTKLLRSICKSMQALLVKTPLNLLKIIIVVVVVVVFRRLSVTDPWL